ncbi:MAG: acetyl-CoA C-acetyltransferase [Paludibacter sp.]|nr:acetyl-CoA C-acetyltransferase [Paludibacter sp.]
MKKVYIIAAKRTAIGKFLGQTTGISAVELASAVIKNILEETQISPALFDEILVGGVLVAGQGQGMARQASIMSGIPVEVPAYGVQMVCGSGMKTILNGFNSIRAGEAELILAGGTESMSETPYLLPAKIRNGIKMNDFQIIDHMVSDGLTDAFSKLHMGITAENIAERFGISREEQDAFALKSQQKAIAAIDSGKFKDEIVPLTIQNKKETIIFDTDEMPNRTTNMEKLAKLRPAFKKDGTVTAGNASGINDGASFVVLASEEMVKKLGLKPMVEIISVGQGGVEPDVMGLGPVPAIAQALRKAEMKLTDIDILELNEAFAAQALGVVRQLSANHNVTQEWIAERTNVNGGAIALGHPIGASGNRIVVSLIYSMLHLNKQIGLASLCIGGGMGTAIILRKND